MAFDVFTNARYGIVDLMKSIVAYETFSFPDTLYVPSRATL